MDITRLTYFSENQVDPSRGSLVSQLSEILSVSRRNNHVVNITGALIFDTQWFLQVLEGDRTLVWQTLKRIEDDERHSNIVIVSAGIVSERLFGDWSMKLVNLNNSDRSELGLYLENDRLDPRHMSEKRILGLMTRLCRATPSRSVQPTLAVDQQSAR